MKLEGLLLDADDIQQRTKTVFATGEQTTVGSFRLITTKPSDKIDVSISSELWDGGKAGELLKKCVGQKMQFNVEFKTMSFADKDGKHVEMKGFHLYSLPEIKG